MRRLEIFLWLIVDLGQLELACSEFPHLLDPNRLQTLYISLNSNIVLVFWNVFLQFLVVILPLLKYFLRRRQVFWWDPCWSNCLLKETTSRCLVCILNCLLDSQQEFALGVSCCSVWPESVYCLESWVLNSRQDRNLRTIDWTFQLWLIHSLVIECLCHLLDRYWLLAVSRCWLSANWLALVICDIQTLAVLILK